MAMGQASNIDGLGGELWYKCGVLHVSKSTTVGVMVKMTLVVMNCENEKMREVIVVEC